MVWVKIWVTDKARKEVKKRAAEEDIAMVDYMDNLLFGENKKKKGGGFDPFF